MLYEHLGALDVSLDTSRVQWSLGVSILLGSTETSIQEDEYYLRLTCS